MLASSAAPSSQAVTQPALKAAFLFKFAKFVEWPADPAGASPLTLCVLDDALAATIEELKGAPVLTVGDGESFAEVGGTIGLFVEDGRMRFAINPNAAHRAGLRLSSQLLKLAKIVKEGRHGQT